VSAKLSVGTLPIAFGPFVGTLANICPRPIVC